MRVLSQTAATVDDRLQQGSQTVGGEVKKDKDVTVAGSFVP